MHFFNYNYLTIIICLHTVIWFQLFVTNANNLHSILLFQTFLCNTEFSENYLIYRWDPNRYYHSASK